MNGIALHSTTAPGTRTLTETAERWFVARIGQISPILAADTMTLEDLWVPERANGQVMVGDVGTLVFTPAREASSRFLVNFRVANLAESHIVVFDPASVSPPRVWFTGFNAPMQSEFVGQHAVSQLLGLQGMRGLVRSRGNAPVATAAPPRANTGESPIPWLAKRAVGPERRLKVAFGYRFQDSPTEDEAQAFLDAAEPVEEAAKPRTRPRFSPRR
jgi:hypothetical protein